MSSNKSICCCNGTPQKKRCGKERKSFPSWISVLLSVGVALFPKCPLCWAMYLSLFGVSGENFTIPYMGWLLPVFFVFLSLILIFQFKNLQRTNCIPFIISVLGFVFLVGNQLLDRELFWLSYIGMGLFIVGAFYNRIIKKSIVTI